MTGSSRGLRGGNWNNNNPFNLSSSNSNSNDPSNENNNIGFRLASPCRLIWARSGWVRWVIFRQLRRQCLVSGTTSTILCGGDRLRLVGSRPDEA